MLKVENLYYSYKDGKSNRKILEDVNLTFSKGHVYSIYGESGSGKTTFLSVLGGLDLPNKGSLYYLGNRLDSSDLFEYRKLAVGFIFQDFNLIPYLSALENVMVGYAIATGKKDKNACLELLESVGISKEISKRKISTLSGGEKQRVAIARALAGDKDIILADEPTGNLDYNTGLEILKILQDLAHAKNKCVIIITHSQEVKSFSDVSLYLNQMTYNFDFLGVGK